MLSNQNHARHRFQAFACRHQARNLRIIKTLFTLELSQYCKSGRLFSSREPVAARRDCCRLGNVTLPSCAGALPQELSLGADWFCSQNLRMSSRIAIGSDCQMVNRGSDRLKASNLDSNLNSAVQPVTNGVEVISSEVPKSTVWSLNSFQSSSTRLKHRLICHIIESSCVGLVPVQQLHVLLSGLGKEYQFSIWAAKYFSQNWLTGKATGSEAIWLPSSITGNYAMCLEEHTNIRNVILPFQQGSHFCFSSSPGACDSLTNPLLFSALFGPVVTLNLESSKNIMMVQVLPVAGCSVWPLPVAIAYYQCGPCWSYSKIKKIL